ncbi:hypothetical protein PENSPDRAFT_96003 [Peniophora sp. CONT]|nr:hypothetical protein PENSPDRAFT_96003 [Peniophora sp. CONT]
MFPDTAFKSGHGEHGARDMRLFRKITVAHSQTSLDLKSFGRPNSSVPNSSVPNPSVPNSSVVDVDPEIGRQLKREIENELRIMVQDTRRERELAMTRAKTDDDRGRADRDYEDTMSTLRALATEMYQNRIQKLAHGWSSHGTSEEDDSSDDDYSSGGESQSSSSTAKPRSSRRTPAHPYDRSGVSHNSLLRSADILALNRQREMDMRDMGV